VMLAGHLLQPLRPARAFPIHRCVCICWIWRCFTAPSGAASLNGPIAVCLIASVTGVGRCETIPRSSDRPGRLTSRDDVIHVEAPL
jgi:hypothetical protein